MSAHPTRPGTNDPYPPPVIAGVMETEDRLWRIEVVALHGAVEYRLYWHGTLVAHKLHTPEQVAAELERRGGPGLGEFRER